MNMPATRFWTFNTLAGAFLDLFIAYFLLCGSTVALFAVKFLGLFGFVGIVSSGNRSLLVDYPTGKVSGVWFSVTRKFPFDSIIFDGGRNGDSMGDLNLDEGSCSSGFDGGNVIGNGMDESVSSCSNWVTCVDHQSNNGEGQGGGPECSSVLSDVDSCNDEADTPMSKSAKRYDEDIVFGDPHDAHKRIPDNEDDKDKMIILLTHELEQSQAECAALYGELEKERNAAASAADEAMSMILRLQEEKALVKMESSQYQRMIEEKSAYDAEEMIILREIVLRREREKHFLEKQVEAHRRIICAQNDQTNIENTQDFVHDPDLMLHQDNSSRLYQDVDFSTPEEPERTIAIVGENGSRVYDIHVIDNEPKSCEKTYNSEACVGLSSASSKSSFRGHSTPPLDNKRTRLDTEVEWLRERLRIVNEGRVKLNFSVNNGEKKSFQLQLLEDIARQLQEIRIMTEPWTACQASLPLPSTTLGLRKKRRCKSVSSEHAKSS